MYLYFSKQKRVCHCGQLIFSIHSTFRSQVYNEDNNVLLPRGTGTLF